MTFFKFKPANPAKGILGFLHDVRGSILPLAALSMPVIVGMAGIGVDASMWLMIKRNIQTAADAGAIAGAWELLNYADDVDAEEAALREARNNTYDGISDDISFEIGTNEDGDTTVSVTLQQELDGFFSRILYREPLTAAAYAQAVISPLPGEYCILALDPTADGAITSVGNVTVVSESCGMAINSSSDTAFEMTGNTSITMGDVNLVGSLDPDLLNDPDFTYSSIQTNSGRASDPYANLDVPPHTACTDDQISAGPTRISGEATVNPGVYCGGLTINANVDVTFNPGVYYIVSGDFSVTGNGVLRGEGVSFVLTDNNSDGVFGNLDIAGGSDISFSAPEAGDLPADESALEGIVFYQDRNATNMQQCSSLTGNATLVIDGAMYFPSNCLDFGGTSETADTDSICTRVIAKTVKLHGTPEFGNSCDASSAGDIGVYRVRLIL